MACAKSRCTDRLRKYAVWLVFAQSAFDYLPGLLYFFLQTTDDLARLCIRAFPAHVAIGLFDDDVSNVAVCCMTDIQSLQTIDLL